MSPHAHIHSEVYALVKFLFVCLFFIYICSGLQTLKIPQRTLVETMAAANDNEVSLVHFLLHVPHQVDVAESCRTHFCFQCVAVDLL